MRRLIVAIGFLTRLPVARVPAGAEDFAAAIRWYPAVGLLVGAAVAAAAAGGRLLADEWTGALAALVAWVAVTGALHLDGLGDVADAVGAAHGDPRRLLAVMADPHLGGFGATAIALCLLAKLVLLHAALVAGPAWALALVPFAARIGPLAWARWLPPLGSGLGASVARAVRARDLFAWGVALLAGAAVVPGLLATPILLAAWGRWARRRLDGVNGDAHGAGIELVECGLLAALLVRLP